MGIEKKQIFNNKNGNKILYVASEVYPLIKTGGLGDVAGSLPIALTKQACDVRIVLPCYANIRSKFKKIKSLTTFQLKGKEINILEAILPGSRVKCWLVDYAPYFDRSGTPYSDINGIDWPDNAFRFDLLCEVSVMLACNQLELNWYANVVHCNDWQTGLIPVYLQQYSIRPACVFTIHNLAYQGLFPKTVFEQLKLDKSLWSFEGLEFYGQLSFMKGGLVFADEVNTVSPRYAEEITSKKYGHGLDGLLRYRKNNLSGILNGIDTKIWHPWKDSMLYMNYNANNLDKKHSNKIAVQSMFNFPKNKNTFLLGMVSRIVEQKGFKEIIAALPKLSNLNIQVIILGCGDRSYEQQLTKLANKYPKLIAVKIGYSENIAHMITAGADAYLMPSTFEPCGLSQLYALRYGTIPIVRNVGGLTDSVNDYNSKNKNIKRATGIVIRDEQSEDLMQAIKRCREAYLDKKSWHKLQRNGMHQDFSWRVSAEKYLDLYSKAMQINLQPLYAAQ